ncbi:MAG: signal recognition particle-docking protein FtsY [Lentisphaeria bacterium]|nr:signal recognition particle-docking protein FtsY [Lentisphaeria bacterium]
MSLFSFFKKGLQKTTTAIQRGIQSVFTDVKKWDDETYRQLEQTLIATDLGPAVTKELLDDLKDRYSRGLIETGADINSACSNKILEILDEASIPAVKSVENGPTVILMVGVNGAGKTTSIAKLAHHYLTQGKKVVLGAGDTFRAAGATQLGIWAQRLSCPVVEGKLGGDSAAVAFDAIKSGISQKADYVIIDTAGRQHTRGDLMAELEKVKRIAGKAMPEAPHEIWLTVDASIGSNALTQAREFGKLFPITGLVLTKLDGTGKGGVVVAIRKELGYPVRFVGLGEQLDDLQPFSAQDFTNALFQPSEE